MSILDMIYSSGGDQKGRRGWHTEPTLLDGIREYAGDWVYPARPMAKAIAADFNGVALSNGERLETHYEDAHNADMRRELGYNVWDFHGQQIQDRSEGQVILGVAVPSICDYTTTLTRAQYGYRITGDYMHGYALEKIAPTETVLLPACTLNDYTEETSLRHEWQKITATPVSYAEADRIVREDFERVIGALDSPGFTDKTLETERRLEILSGRPLKLLHTP